MLDTEADYDYIIIHDYHFSKSTNSILFCGQLARSNQIIIFRLKDEIIDKI